MKLYGIIGIMDGEVTVRPELYSSKGTAQEVADVLVESTGFDRVGVAVFSLVDGKAQPPSTDTRTDQQKLIDTLTEIGIPHTVDDDMVNIGTEVMMDEMSYAQVKFDSYGKFTELD